MSSILQFNTGLDKFRMTAALSITKSGILLKGFIILRNLVRVPKVNLPWKYLFNLIKKWFNEHELYVTLFGWNYSTVYTGKWEMFIDFILTKFSCDWRRESKINTAKIDIIKIPQGFWF